MRTLEWLFWLAFIPVLLLPFIGLRWRRLALLAFAPLPLVVGVVQLVVEGWRIQLVPLYGLALVVLLLRLPALLGQKSDIRYGRGLLISGVVALGLIGTGILAGWLLPVVTLPEPTGTYKVGMVDRELVDGARNRHLMVSIWYPAAEAGTPAPLTHHPDAIAEGLGNLSGVPGVVLQHLRYTTLAASENAPIATDGAPFPVLVFSHGMVGLRLQNSSTLQELASWGYVVVALDHTDASAVTVFESGEARFYDLARFGVPPDVEPNQALMDEYVLPVWVADQRFVYDMLEAWTVNDPLLADKLDLTRIGSFGHSFGGATALEVCRVDARCKAAVNMDGALYGASVTEPAVRPLLLMSSADSSQYTETMNEWTALIANAQDTAYWLELPNSTHFSFTITQLLSPFLVPVDFQPRAGLHIIDQYLRAFFDKELRGIETLPLGAASTATDVRWLAEAPSTQGSLFAND